MSIRVMGALSKGPLFVVLALGLLRYPYLLAAVRLLIAYEVLLISWWIWYRSRRPAGIRRR